MRRYWLVLLLALLTACDTLRPDDVPATRRVELTAYATEAAQIQAALVLRRTEAVATIAAAGTLAADYYRYNQVLVATVQAVVPPTPVERVSVQIDSSGGANASQVNQIGGMTSLSQVGIASTIRQDNGCFESQATFFNVNEVGGLYLTARADNLQAGTRLEAVWEYEGQETFRSARIIQASQMDSCVALPVTTADMAFLPGLWAVTLNVNGQAAARIPFEMIAR
ncbi:MAG: hypothetical protein MUE40_00255 [Anaerolineae bacterium]|jgi:hypothetical protein|nr:hypothetical protein [Anaerolineae bacterium]